MRTLKKWNILVLLIAVGLIAAGCDGNTTEESTTSEPTGTTAGEVTSTTAEGPPVSLEGEVDDHGVGTVEGGSIEVEQDDFYFEPTYISAEPGETVEIELTNEGSTAHTFTIEGQDIDIVLDPEQSETVEVTIPESGSLPFFCRFHVSQGMQGALFTSDG